MSNERAIQLVDAATWLQLSGDTEGARRLFEQALKLDPGNVKALEHLAGTRATSSIEDATSSPSGVVSLDGDWGAATTGEAPPPAPPSWDAESTRVAPVPAALLGPPPPPTWDSETTRVAPVSASLLGPPPPPSWDGESTRVAAVPSALLGPPPPPADALTAPGPTATAPMASFNDTLPRPPPLPLNEDTLFGDMESGVRPAPKPATEEFASFPPMPPPPPADDAKTLPGLPALVAPPPPADDEVTTPGMIVADAGFAAPDAPLSVPVVHEAPLAATANSAWDARSDPGIQLASGGEAKAMELLAAASAVVIPPAEPQGESVDRLMRGAKDLLDLDDHTGAMELILKAKALAPNDPEVEAMRERSEATLVAMFESKLRGLQAVPRVLLKDDEIIWLNLDHRAGFVLAQIDASVTFDDIFSLSGMSRLDTARILAQLIDEGVISRG